MSDPGLFTRPRQVAFLAALAATGSVRSASASAGVSHQTAYRARLASPGFRRGWDAALLAARAQAEEVLACRALEGWEEDVVYHGEVVASRRRFSDRLLLAHLARLDRLCGDAEVAEFADRFDEVLARYEAGEDRPARVVEAVAEVDGPSTGSGRAGCGGGPSPDGDFVPTGSGRAGVGVDSEGDGFLSPGQWSMWSTSAAGPEAVPPPLPVETDSHGETLTEAQRLGIGHYGVWWQAEADGLLTNWPAPPDWAGEAWGLDEDEPDELLPLADHPDLAAVYAALDDEGRAAVGWARTLSPAEAAGLEAAQAAQAEARVARRALYHRAAFGLASAAELAALDTANPGRSGPWLAVVTGGEEDDA
jgi:hypothetical protein